MYLYVYRRELYGIVLENKLLNFLIAQLASHPVFVWSLSPPVLFTFLSTFLRPQQIYRKNIVAYVGMEQVHKNMNWLEGRRPLAERRFDISQPLQPKRYDDIDNRERICRSTKGQKMDAKYVVVGETKRMRRQKSRLLYELFIGRSRRAENWEDNGCSFETGMKNLTFATRQILNVGNVAFDSSGVVTVFCQAFVDVLPQTTHDIIQLLIR